jgi:uncharacterized membrane protein
MKSGLQTTEGWITFAIVVVGLVIASGLLPVDSTAMKIAGLAAAVLKALAYTWSRTVVKTTAANDNAPPADKAAA